jgi:hypothetical protein
VALSAVALADSERDTDIDEETAALMALGFGEGYANTHLPYYRRDNYGYGGRYGYPQRYRDGWRDYGCHTGRYKTNYYPYYRWTPRTGIRVRIGDSYFSWEESGYGSYFGFGNDWLHYRKYDSDGHETRYYGVGPVRIW